MTEVDQVALDQSLHEAFEPGRLPFCHDPNYRLKSSDRWLCSLSQGEAQRCPALKQECALAAKPDPKNERQSHTSKPSDSSLSVPAWLGLVAELAFWALVAALVGAVVVSIVRMRRSRDEVDDEPAGPTSIAPPPADAPAPIASGDRDVARLLERARRAAEQGNLAAAIDAAHAAAVQGLSSTGNIEVDLDRTNGDYVRELRKAPPLQQEFRAIVNQVELAQFGGVAPTRGAFDRVLEQVLSLLRRLAVLSIVVLPLMGLFGCGGARAPGESEETSPSGLYAFKRIMADQGAKVHTRVAPLTKLEPGVGVVLLLGADLDEQEQKQLLRWVQSGGALVVVGSSDFMDQAEVSPKHQACGHHAERGPGSELTPLRLAVPGERALSLQPVPESDVVQRVDVTCGGAPYIATSFLDDGTITFVPERELLSNASLSMADNARLVAEIFAIDEGSTIELVGPWTGDGADSPIQSLKSAGMLPAMLQLLGLALLLAIRKGSSFGARRDEQERERRAFSDHVRAVASNYAKAGAGRLVSGHYGLLLIEQMRERLCPGQAPTLLQLAAVVARRVQRPEPEIVELLVEAKTRFDDANDGQGVNHKIIRELEQLSLQAGGIS